MGKLGVFAFAITITVALVVLSLPDGSRANPHMEDDMEMAEALHLLEKLDKYYSQIARPRYGRSLENRRSDLSAIRSEKSAVKRGRR
ncbi:neuropeptide F-like [Parasteatoda tepidariorum]|uniref:neuropeptide F-like n=1 Tax=Parasteatoda tepidariorum TaxID=114398 RepID=UPI00077FAF43|nr:neuropeptide F-like [Parasteatoda tepidariorum]